MIVYIILGLLFTYFALSYDKFDSKSQVMTAWIAFFILFVIAGFRGRWVDIDYHWAYEYFIDRIPDATFLCSDFDGFIDYVNRIFVSPPDWSFCFLVSFLKLFGDKVMPVVAFIYAFWGVYLKIKAWLRLSDRNVFGYVLLFYFANLFLLQEMTQIRAGVATALVLLSLPCIVEKRFFKFFFIILLACFIHKSSFIAFPLYFLNNDKMNFKLWLGGLFVIMGMAICRVDVISIILDYNVPVLHEKMNNYMMMQDWLKIKVNLFSVFNLLQLLVTCLLCYKHELILPHCKYLYLLLKVSIVGMMCFYFFTRVPVFSYRLSDMLGAVTCLLYPLLYYVFKQKLFSQWLLVGMAWGILLMNLFHNGNHGLVRAYYMIFFD